MAEQLVGVLKVAAALGCGLNAGVFFAFSTFVMGALGRLTPAHGITAMQSINVMAITPLFMTALFGTGVVGLALITLALLQWPVSNAPLVIAGASLYVAGTLVVTLVFNVPRNNALAAVDAASAEGARVWSGYLRTWTAWNHVRTIAALAAAALLTLAI
jgi:uncharacterized membrane protein